MKNLRCSECNSVFQGEFSVNDELGGREIVIKGATSPMEASLLCSAIVLFFSWPHRNLLNSEGFSAGMRVDGYKKKNWPWQKVSEVNAFVFSTPTTIVISRVDKGDL